MPTDASQMPLVQRAWTFAYACHAAVGQRRKYSGEPYIVHPAKVAAIVRQVPHTPAMLCAAWLHDVVEDTEVSLADIERLFGSAVANLVDMLTNPTKSPGLSWRDKKQIDLEHIRRAAPAAKTVKLADIIDNCTDIRALDPQFAPVYLAEKREQLAVLREGDPVLWSLASDIIVGRELRPLNIATMC